MRRRHQPIESRQAPTKSHAASRTKVGGGNDPKHPPASFKPSVAQFRYLRALQDALQEQRSVTDTALCQGLKMSRTTLWEWRQDRCFVAWMKAELDRTDDLNWELVLLRHCHLAIRGSVRSAEFLLKVRLLARAPQPAWDGAGPAATNYTVHILAPRPASPEPAA